VAIVEDSLFTGDESTHLFAVGAAVPVSIGRRRVHLDAGCIADWREKVLLFDSNANTAVDTVWSVVAAIQFGNRLDWCRILVELDVDRDGTGRTLVL